MNSAGPALRDLHLPQVSWWPPAIGWWLLAMLVLLVAFAIAFTWLRGRNARALRRTARCELDALAERHARDRNDAVLAAGLSRLLRRIALLLQPDVVSNNGWAWREFLSNRVQAAFTGDQLDALIEAPYRTGVSFDAVALVAATRQWCKHALRPRKPKARKSP
ncbi:MAG: DUF4381 domain-containing protein [Rhodanobacteraceae bacterium]